LIDFYPKLKGTDRFLWSYSGVQFKRHEDALIVQQRIKAHTDHSKTLAEAVSAYRKPEDQRNQSRELTQEWTSWVARCGEIEPCTIRGYRGHVNNQFDWWRHRTIDDVSRNLLDKWVNEMRTSLAPKTVVNVLATMRSFLRWHRMREKAYVILEFPRVKRDKRKKPVTMPLFDQAAVLAAIPEDDRGGFLSYAHLTLQHRAFQ
jgi:hypothetical protein